MDSLQFTETLSHQTSYVLCHVVANWVDPGQQPGGDRRATGSGGARVLPPGWTDVERDLLFERSSYGRPKVLTPWLVRLP